MEDIKLMLERLKQWIHKKTAPEALVGGQWTGTSYIDSFKRNRNPTPNELMAELKATDWTCATINSAVCASYPPSLYVITRPGEQPPKCQTKPIPAKLEKKLRDQNNLLAYTKSATKIHEVLVHPILDLLA